MANPNQQMLGYNWNQPTCLTNQSLPQQAPMMNQQQMIAPQISYIPGRSVTAPEEVKAYEVPMSSPYSIFPRGDMLEIYVKYWNESGLIDTKVYRLVETDSNETKDDQNAATNPAIESMQRQLNRIEKILKQRNSKPYKPKNQQKEGSE